MIRFLCWLGGHRLNHRDWIQKPVKVYAVESIDKTFLRIPISPEIADISTLHFEGFQLRCRCRKRIDLTIHDFTEVFYPPS